MPMPKQKWEYMFVEFLDGLIIRIKNQNFFGEYKNPEDRPVWESWLGECGRKGWELAAEYSLNGKTVHATLKRPI
jgi:hypothetical protein